MDKPAAIEDVDRRIRLVREVSEQRDMVSEEHLNDLLREHHHSPPTKTDNIQCRFQDTLSNIIKLEAEYTQKILELQQALDKVRTKADSS